jgi:hypothetical protein
MQTVASGPLYFQISEVPRGGMAVSDSNFRVAVGYDAFLDVLDEGWAADTLPHDDIVIAASAATALPVILDADGEDIFADIPEPERERREWEWADNGLAQLREDTDAAAGAGGGADSAEAEAGDGEEEQGESMPSDDD